MHYAFVIPFRNRYRELEVLLPHLRSWVARQPYIHTQSYLVVEQADERRFNLGWCLNVGFSITYETLIEEPHGATERSWRFVFQPVDCLPLDRPVARQGTPDQLQVDVPPAAWAGESFVDYYKCPANTAVLLQPRWWTGANWSQYGTYYKALVFDPAAYRAINGHSNRYEGWGKEDDDLLLRLRTSTVQVEHRGAIFHELPNPPQEHSDDGNRAALADAENRVATDGLSDLVYDFEWVKNFPPRDVMWAHATR